ncbi:MAG: AzlD domain-containing protein [Planktomarina sp.]|nr:AzlD domain-containing protein [Planktomarina sp.]MDT2073370.1 AzlD domain-containing protein [Planktomarina sp.]
MVLGSWLLRLSFLGIISNKELPKWAKRHLRYTVAAVMPGGS